MTTPMNADEIVHRVERRSGLTGLVDAGLQQRLATLVAQINRHAHLDAARLPAALAQVEQRLAERLALERDFVQQPALRDEAIERPIFVVGYSRTGTTVMHCLLGEDSGHRMPRFWEALQPSPPPGLDAADPSSRLAAADAQAQAWLAHVPGLLAAHPYWDAGAQTPIEDEEIFSVDFHTAYPTHYYRVPFSPLDMAAADPLPAYRFHRRFLQHRQHRMPPRRWVCKGVMHQFCLDQLWTVYPDALCVWTHRDPAEMIASTLGIYTVLYDAVTGGIDRPAQAARMIDSMRAGYDHLLAQPWLDDPRIVHVRFQDLIAEPVDTVRRVYDRAGLPFSSEQETRIRHWLQANRADRHGKFRYTLDGYGVTAQALRSRFADYAARFLG